MDAKSFRCTNANIGFFCTFAIHFNCFQNERNRFINTCNRSIFGRMRKKATYGTCF